MIYKESMMSEARRKRRFAAVLVVIGGMILFVEPLAPPWMIKGDGNFKIAIWGAPGMTLWGMIGLLFPTTMIDPDIEMSRTGNELRESVGIVPMLLPSICLAIGAALRWFLV